MDVLSSRLAGFFPKDSVYLIYALNLLIVFGIITLLFTVIFKTLPDGRMALRDCLIGASFTTVLFMIGKFAIGAYLGRSAISSWYGAAGSVILILVWVYYSAIILYFGAEFTKVFAETHGKKIIPNGYAVQIIKHKIEVEELRMAEPLKDDSPKKNSKAGTELK
jgi:membrane protein